MNLESWYSRLFLIKYFRKGLIFKGNPLPSVTYLLGQENLLDKIIYKENIETLKEYVKHTEFAGDFNIVTKVNKGIEHILKISKYPHEWFLYVVKIDDIYKYEKCSDYEFIRLILEESRDKETLVFETEKPETVSIIENNIPKEKFEYVKYMLVFSKNNISDNGLVYTDNKWQ